MKGSMIDDFIKYAKEQFGYDIVLRTCDQPDTFASIFGASFLDSELAMERVEGLGDGLCYDEEFTSASIFSSFDFLRENQMEVWCLDSLGMAA